MSAELMVAFLLLALLAEVLGTLGGFGSSLFFVPLAGFFLEFHAVLGLTALFHVMSNLAKIGLFGKKTDRRILLWLGIPSVLLVIAGAALSPFWSTTGLEMTLAFFLMGLSAWLWIKPEMKMKDTTGRLLGAGAAAGFMAGLVGTGGALRGLAMSALNLEKEVFVATSALIDLGVDGSRAVVYALNGYVRQEDLYLLPGLAVVSLLGSWIGKQLLQKLPQSYFRKLVLGFIFFSGFATFWRLMGW